MANKEVKIQIDSETRYRVSIFRSNKSITGQIVDDAKGLTIAASTSAKAGAPTEQAMKAGEELAGKATKLGVKKLKYDRNGYRYHGRVKAFAEGLRKGGLDL